MIVPHEDTYWNDRDDVTIVSGDPAYKLKVDFMREHDIVIFRMHDHMHAQKPDFIYVGLARALGLESKYETAPQSHHFTLSETTLGELAATFQKRLGDKGDEGRGRPKGESEPPAARRGIRDAEPSTTPTWTSSSAESSRKATAFSTARRTSWTPRRWGFRKAGSCSATRCPKSRGCWKWPSGSSRLRPRSPFSSSGLASPSGRRSRLNWDYQTLYSLPPIPWWLPRSTASGRISA